MYVPDGLKVHAVQAGERAHEIEASDRLYELLAAGGPAVQPLTEKLSQILRTAYDEDMARCDLLLTRAELAGSNPYLQANASAAVLLRINPWLQSLWMDAWWDGDLPKAFELEARAKGVRNVAPDDVFAAAELLRDAKQLQLSGGWPDLLYPVLSSVVPYPDADSQLLIKANELAELAAEAGELRQPESAKLSTEDAEKQLAKALRDIELKIDATPTRAQLAYSVAKRSGEAGEVAALRAVDVLRDMTKGDEAEHFAAYAGRLKGEVHKRVVAFQRSDHLADQGEVNRVILDAQACADRRAPTWQLLDALADIVAVAPFTSDQGVSTEITTLLDLLAERHAAASAAARRAWLAHPGDPEWIFHDAREAWHGEMRLAADQREAQTGSRRLAYVSDPAVQQEEQAQLVVPPPATSKQLRADRPAGLGRAL